MAMVLCIVCFSIVLVSCGATASTTSETPQPVCSYVVAVDAAASKHEHYAAQQLSQWLSLQRCDPPLPVVTPEEAVGKLQFAVGYTAARALNSSIIVTDLGLEGFVLQSVFCTTTTTLCSYLMTGQESAPRGAIYAVYQFLQQYEGFAFWTPNVTSLPTELNLSLILTDITFIPALEFRDINNAQFELEDKMAWSVSMRNNAQEFGDDEVKWGDGIRYASPPGAVHTSFTIVPPSVYQKANPEWYGGQQLCWSNDSLVAVIIDKVKDYLRSQPNASIVSVSQNDNTDYCQTPPEMAIINEEGSPSGPLIRAINKIADAIKDEFPYAAIDTLAYEYTRAPPKLTKPRPNVIVRLCSIECNFALPLTDPSNAAFQKDIVNWSLISNRLYIWDYIVNFANFVMPWPNWYVLGPNIKFFLNHGVKGIFEEGDYVAFGGDMQELKSWLLAQLLWDPSQDDKVLINQFLDGYFGPAGPLIGDYLDLFHDSAVAANESMPIFCDVNSAYLTPQTLLASAYIFEKAKAAVATDPTLLSRVLQAELPTLYVFLLRYTELQTYAHNHSLPWPPTYGHTATEGFDYFANVYTELGLQHGTLNPEEDTALSEDGHGLQWLKQQIEHGYKPSDKSAKATFNSELVNFAP